VTLQAGASPPPVAFATFLEVAPGGSATGFGELAPGQVGVGCVRGEAQDDDFRVTLAGRFDVVP
jgi:hypothetical protein